MRLHNNTIKGVHSALEAIFEEGQYADKVIARTLKSNPKWGAKDRAFIAETTYDMVRWWRLINYLSKSKDYWDLFGTYWLMKGNELPPWEEFKGLNPERLKGKYESLEDPATIESFPDWLYQLGEKELGDKWMDEVHSLNQEAEVVLRVNTIKANREKLKNRLKEDGILTHTIKGYPDALILEERQNVFQNPAFKEGLFEVQDGSSQLVAEAMAVEPGMRVIDACAGAGGKALHIAAKMENKGKIIAMDLEEWKLQQTKLRARRSGVSIIERKLIEGSKTIKRLKESADRLLLDVPCSGLGVLRRNPDTKWKLSEESIKKVQETQAEILQTYPTMLKPGGQMVYATCSVLPSENQEQVQKFLSSEAGKNFELMDEQRILSQESGFDGFYIARLLKK
ncbi:RsmB/NOP family class I SAM-dependent RNA methyltransferase [Algoriphagus sediminis]|uniref:Class I SAM-dependent methyltransferase n=1 Tax=Algoriphagus sediminis TaxID=3057113 RepID=A0ABT7YCN7_9BACT|nr:class I SAM-dependent methyltransferase [Algoriphagus sediminis]MDN3204267.1 class I SAM-dependent methyltransferase [Algoriphagus sediminis]